MDEKKLLDWLDKCVAWSIKYEIEFEGQREVTGRYYHEGQRKAFQMVMQQIERGSFDELPRRDSGPGSAGDSQTQ